MRHEGEQPSGELIIEKKLTVQSPYLSDQRYLGSPARGAIEELGLVTRAVNTAKAAIEDLGIKKPVTIKNKTFQGIDEGEQIRSIGVGATVAGENTVELSFDPLNQNVVENLATYWDRNLAHELEHIARANAGRRGNTLLDAIVSEGLAMYYGEHWQGQYLPTPWIHSFSEEQIREEWGKAQLRLDSETFDRGDWFFGLAKVHPVWTGYALGVAIIEAYMQRYPGESMRRLLRRDSKKILERSKFTP